MSSRQVTSIVSSIIVAACFAIVPVARAHVAHVVQPGESLSSVAAVHGIGIASLAAANGLPVDGFLISGTTIQVPVGTGSASTTATVQAVTATSGAGHVVKPGETLSGIAAAHGISLSALASANGLSITSWAVAGSTLKLPGGSSTAVSTTPVSYVSGGGNPVPTQERLTATTVGDIAQRYGMSRSLVQAVGWQESGFNNALTSSANARGVMQIIPPTWDFINKNLAGGTLNPASAHDNVVAGTLYLRHLYRVKGGDRDLTIGSYYQGPARDSVLPETRTYIDSVLSHKNWFASNPR